MTREVGDSVVPTGEAEHAILTGLGARFDHVGIAVPSIGAVLPLYIDLLGGRPVSGRVSPWAGHMAVQIQFSGGSRIELLEPTSANSPSIGRFLESNPRGGLHHVTFKVDDIYAMVEKVEAAGFTLVSTRLERPEWKETFIHPRDAHGALIQLVQADPNYPPPLDMPMPELLAEAERLREEERRAKKDTRH